MKSIVCCALVIVACGFSVARAQDCCDHCGCQCCCQKICRVVCETKKVPKVTYTCECEDFCVPGPSDHCVTCDECGNKKHVYTPTCGHVRTRKKLVKHETMEEVPSYKWVVETVCNGCASKCADQGPPAVNGVSRLPAEKSGVRQAGFQGSGNGNAESSSTSPSADSENRGLTAQIRRMVSPVFGQK
jgi:hypothetical protein